FGHKVHSFYGTSETGGICYDGGAEVEEPPRVGRPLPGVEVSLEPHPGTERGAGQVFVRGGAVAAGYVEGAGDERARFVDGGFLTGDLASRDATGRLRLEGRVTR